MEKVCKINRTRDARIKHPLPLILSLILFLLLCHVDPVLAQRRDAPRSFGQIFSLLDTMQQRLPREKLYLQLDKPYYAAGDTIWFKGYLLNADSLDASSRSGILYLELADGQNEVVQRISIPLAGGLCWGDLPLDVTLFHPGDYTLRAYTNWMLNFGEAGIFSRQIHVVSDEKSAWTIGLQQQDEGDRISIGLQFKNILQQPLRRKALQVRLLKNGRSIHKNNFTTDGEGQLNLDFDIPKTGSGNMVLDIQDDSSHKVSIPLLFHRPEDIDLQFMPEGGRLVGGYAQRIGFKAIGDDGKGVAVQGGIYNDQGKQVASFQSLHAGMGSFFLKTQRGEKYNARLYAPDSTGKQYELPPVQSSGTILEVKRADGVDSLRISIFASADLASSTHAFILLGQSGGGQLLYHKKISVAAKGIFLSVPTKLFPEGVIRFTLMDLSYRPLNERVVFVHHDNNLKINLHTDKVVYHPHDSIALHMEVKEASGKPVFGYFSVAVTDNNQVKISPNAGNILSYFHLSSCVKGYVEDPSYYIRHSDSVTDVALDNLLLTQGWVGYDWKAVLSPPQRPAYEAEKTFEVKGKVVNALNQPIKHAKVILASQKPAFVRTMTTDPDGRFVFTHFRPIDTPHFFIQALNRRGKSFNVGIDIERFTPPLLPPVTFPIELPWNVNINKTLSNYITDNQEKLQLSGIMLKPVEVKAKKIISGSQNINGPGEADIVIDESEISKFQNISIAEFLRRYLSGFNVMDSTATLNGYDVHFIIEGMTLQYVSDIITDPLNTLTTDDIKGIEIMYSPKYVYSYDARFAVLKDPNILIKRKRPVAYIEITTRRPTTLWEQTKPGIAIYTPIPISWPREFYRPRYTIKALDTLNRDLRSTIHWEPNVDMETKGQGLVTFYAADRPGVYTIILEGSDMKGHLGYSTAKIKIEEE